jgi:TonB family protein
MSSFRELLNWLGLGERFAGLAFRDFSMLRVLERPDQERYYPEASRRVPETGTVRLALAVGQDGVPRRVRLIESSGYLRLDDAAQRLALDFRFSPSDDPTHRRGWQTQIGVVFRDPDS